MPSTDPRRGALPRQRAASDPRVADGGPAPRGSRRAGWGAAGICASDHHVMEGLTALPLPSVLGHEGAGTVESVGPGVTGVQPGDRCILSFVSSCGHCSSCRRGRPNLCDSNAATGTRQYDGTTRLTDAEGLRNPADGQAGRVRGAARLPRAGLLPDPRRRAPGRWGADRLLRHDRRRRGREHARHPARLDRRRVRLRRRGPQRRAGRGVDERVADHRRRYPRPQTGVRARLRRHRHHQCARRRLGQGDPRADRRRRRLRLRRPR